MAERNRVVKVLFTIGWFFACSVLWAVESSEESSVDAESAKQQTTLKEKEVEKEVQKGAQTTDQSDKQSALELEKDNSQSARVSPDKFIPKEKISEDLSVSFPVDI